VLKIFMLMKRKPGLSMAEFIERYETEHVPLAEKQVTSLRHYERHYLHPGRHVVLGDEAQEPEYDVITELWYDDVAAFEAQQDWLRARPDRVAEIIADEETIFDRSKSRVVLVEDHASDLGERGVTATRERTLQRLVDKDEIVDLVHRYSYYVDHRMHDDVAALFTEDCVVDYGPGIAPPLRGRQAVRGMFGGNREPTEARPGFAATSHQNANVLVTFDGDDRALVHTSLYAWHRTTQDATPRVWGYYDDVAVRTPDGWRLAERRLRVAGHQDWPVDWHPLLPED
jgi:hypothetical protein